MTAVCAMTLPTPDEAMADLLPRIAAVPIEPAPLSAAAGRVLAQDVLADRDSPACDVSAMDGYAVRLADLGPDGLPVAGESPIGRSPLPLPPGRCVRLFTGAAVPPEADAVIRREDVEEQPGRIRLIVPVTTLKRGQNIRRRGENLEAGRPVLMAGTRIDGPAAAALATFGVARPRVHRRVRVAILTTGDELLPASAAVNPWQVRDANGPALHALLAPVGWLEVAAPRHVRDDAEAIREAVLDALSQADALVLSGGVSMGDHDHVPAAVRDAGASVVFHKLAIRPGKPVLAAIGPRQQVIFGLPGNPVSVLVTARRLLGPALARRAGIAQPLGPDARVMLKDADGKSLSLTWFRPVRLLSADLAQLVATRGSGDVASAARSDGFIEAPPQAAHPGETWPFWRWSLA